MVGRLSMYAKNRILNLRFQKNQKITQIAKTLEDEDNIKVSRESVSAFLKKYNETKSIHDKPRPGRKKKLTEAEINLIGEVTRLNRDITAPKIKEYLNLKVSPYTILRATKLFEWNKFNPNSNQAKKQAALERQLRGEKKRKSYPKKKKVKAKLGVLQKSNDLEVGEVSTITDEEYAIMLNSETNESHNLGLLTEHEIIYIKNLSSSPMVFATKVLYKLFTIDEIKGHYVCGKIISRNIRHKQPLLDKRILYIKWLVENNFEANKENLWQQCRRAINKSILNNERRDFRPSYESLKSRNSKKSFIQITNDIAESKIENDLDEIYDVNENEDNDDDEDSDNDDDDDDDDYGSLDLNDETESINTQKVENETNSLLNNSEYDLKLLSDEEIQKLRHSTCSPMIFATKLLFRIFSLNELHGHNVTGKTFHKINNSRVVKQQLDENRVIYIKFLVNKYFKGFRAKSNIWKSCVKAINRIIRKSEAREQEKLSQNTNLQLLSSTSATLQTNESIQQRIDSTLTVMPDLSNTTQPIHQNTLVTVNECGQVQPIIIQQHQLIATIPIQYQLINEDIQNHQQFQIIPQSQQTQQIIHHQLLQFDDLSQLAYHASTNFYN